MSQAIHYIMLLLLVFIIAEIRNVLVYSNPYQAEQVSIWNEAGNIEDSNSHKLVKRL
ncbi:MAG: hypothetical protein GY702_06105 [Desulfobulbaceae bacterium]|nr:hypothetical protein [Desulfobulbaceae bacterium]